MERRTAFVASIATGVSLTLGVVAYAATGGASILGLGSAHRAGSGRAADPLVVHQVQTIEDEIVVSSRSTDVPRPVEREVATASVARPPGVPVDWPANKPIPPMPASCQQPQLEDNGVWKCDH